MSGIVGYFARPGGDLDRDAFRRSFAALDHHGRHGRPAALGDWWALGRQIHEKEPERPSGGLGRRGAGPTSAPAGPGSPWIAWDGYLDNRRELCGELGLVSSRASDSSILALAWEAWGEAMFERIVGPLAILLVDPRRRRVVAARDALGDRLLVYRHLPDGSLLVASEEQALLAFDGMSPELDETALAHFLAVRPLPPGRTFFRGVHSIPAGHVLSWDGRSATIRRHWHPPLESSLDPRSDDEWIEEARHRFREAVRCRVPDAGRVAVLMSGGLDSTSIAVEAAELLTEQCEEAAFQGLHTISWIFEELAPADERPWIGAMADTLGLRSSRIAADRAWPLSGAMLPGGTSGECSWPTSPNLPAETTYRRLLDSSYALAREEGTPVLLSGDYADQLYVGCRGWLAELLREGRWVAGSARALWETVSSRGLGLRSAIGGLLPRSTPARPDAPPWLTDRAAALLEDPACLPSARRPEQVAAITAGWAVPYENARAARTGVEIRRPYRDRRLVELFLRMPAHVQYRPGWRKWAARKMMEGRLPESVRRRRRATTMLPLVQRGLVEREAETVRSWLRRPDELWSRFVRRDWLDARFPSDLAAGRDGAASLVPWHCLCLEMWRARHVTMEAAA